MIEIMRQVQNAAAHGIQVEVKGVDFQAIMLSHMALELFPE